MRSWATFVALAAAISSVFAAPTSDSYYTPTKFFTLNLRTENVAPDGYPVQMKLANHQIDYAIEVNAGDTVSVTVINNLGAPTSIHWHGMFQRGTPWMDGAGGVTQCPIPPGGSYVYTFNVGQQVGTYWWHAHYISGYVDGIRGPFIIHDPKDPYKGQYSEEKVITLVDHYHNTSAYLLDYCAFEPVPESGLINGVGVYDCKFAKPGSGCRPASPYVLNFTPGKTYRLRLINEGAMAPFEFSIDNHVMTVIESDGVYTNPTVVDNVRILPSQRYSVLVTANQRVSNYFIRATMDVAMWAPAPVDLNGLNPNVTGIVRYAGAPARTPTSTSNITNPLDAYHLGELNGLTSDTLPDDFNQTLYFGFSLQPNDENITRAAISITDSDDLVNIDDSQYRVPSYPDLLSVVGGKNASQLPATSNAVNVYNGTYVYLQVRNDDAVEHVFHLHGHTFWVINSGKLLHADKAATYPRRDAIQVPPCTGGKGGGGEASCLKGYVGLLIKFDNPGVWLFHCHIEWHMSAGLLFTFVNNAGLANAATAAKIPRAAYSCANNHKGEDLFGLGVI
ncbi:multicopper oxidase [Gonapodya prolifera JEL478]|uniref:Multicopper oxidase n=1 Tax=Gonapodya prolifera (strain JEL478) TaxID=1344416 RepID=A0A138ZX76_GONPJ|nr:multicopper oxidase [Gonapodya prolifera JEL478]|eukprot:KXS09097.1 multicopper oxidase [Gonapodya prolifera JEL478]